MSTNKAGTSAAQLQREIGVTYKCAWRMMHQIRTLMNTDKQLSGEVEVDETYVHANVYKRSTAQKRYGRTGQRAGQVLFGAVERGGRVRIWHVKSAGARILQPLIRKNVKEGTLIHTDGYRAYRRLPQMGFGHRWTDHGRGEYYTEDSYTQNIENVWSHFKRGIKGVYRHVDNKYLQAYANEYAWRYSNRKKPSMFWSLMCRVGS
jgi:transposase-like protein